MEIHGRQGFGRWSFPLFYYAVAQTPIRALRIKHFRKAGRKNEYKEETGRQELAETGGRISLQGYRCTEKQTASTGRTVPRTRRGRDDARYEHGKGKAQPHRHELNKKLYKINEIVDFG